MEKNTWSYLVGDIHGCYEEFLKLEEKIISHAEKNEVKPFIISVGDMIDRGPDSAKVVSHFYQGTLNKTHAAIMGNHELLMLEALQYFAPFNFEHENCQYPEWFWTYKLKHRAKKGMAKYLSWKDYVISMKGIWLSQGGYNCLKSFGCNPDLTETWIIPEEIISFLINLPLFFESDSFITTHALPLNDDLQIIKELNDTTKKNKLHPTEKTERLRESSRSVIWNRVLPAKKPDNKPHISGHTPYDRPRRRKKINCIQIDTGCVFGGRLTAWCVDADEFISVKALQKYAE